MNYFDNAATTYPKPRAVISSLSESAMCFGANPGRSGHKMAYDTAEKIYNTRETISDFFDLGMPDRVIFTKNCTESLNLVIKGLALRGGHFVCSDLEHNAVARPLEALKAQKICDWSMAHVGKTDEETLFSFERCMRKNTLAIICTAASNVFGKVLPIQKLANLAHKHGVVLVVDAAQAAGVLPMHMRESGIDFLCAPGHKGLYGPMGTGVLLCASSKPLATIIEGGTGTLSAQLTQPENYPERLESGTLNVLGIIALSEGVRFVAQKGEAQIYRHEMRLMKFAFERLQSMPNVILYTDLNSPTERFVPLLSFNILGKHSEETAQLLAAEGIAVRAGLHCAGLAHKAYHTEETGTVRICPSVFTKEKDVNSLLNSVFKIAKAV